MNLGEYLGPHLLWLRQERGLTKAAVVQRVEDRLGPGHLNRGHLRKLERGMHAPTLAQVHALAVGLDVTVAAILAPLEDAVLRRDGTVEVATPIEDAFGTVRVLASRRGRRHHGHAAPWHPRF